MTWAYRELASVHLGDARLDVRLMGMVEGFSEHPEASCGEALGEAGAKAAYRLLDNDRVEADDILEPHAESTAERAGAYGTALALQDTTEVNLTDHPATTGLGYLGSPHCQGLMLHSLLVVSPTGVPLGVVWQECWVRPEEQLGKSQQRRQLPLEEKESQRWLNGLAAADKTLPKHPHVVVVGDRESDIFALFAAPRPDRMDLLVRVCRETRRVEHKLKYLNKILEAEPIRGYVQIHIPPRAGRQERHARLSVRSPPARSMRAAARTKRSVGEPDVPPRRGDRSSAGRGPGALAVGDNARGDQPGRRAAVRAMVRLSLAHRTFSFRPQERLPDREASVRNGEADAAGDSPVLHRGLATLVHDAPGS